MTGDKTRLTFGDPASIEAAYGKPNEHKCPEMDKIAVFSDQDLRNSGEGSCEIVEITMPIDADSEEVTFIWSIQVSFSSDELLTVTGLVVCPFCKEPLKPRRPEPLPDDPLAFG